MNNIRNLYNTAGDTLSFYIYLTIVSGILYSGNEFYQSKPKAPVKTSKIKFGTPLLPKAKVVEQKDVFKVKYKTGDVEIKTIDPVEKTRSQIFIKDVIKSGEIVKTGDNGILVLSFGKKDRSLLKIDKNSEVVLNYEKLTTSDKNKSLYNQATELVLKNGNVLLDIKDKYKKNGFKVSTSNATLGVRGTIFLVAVDDLKKRILSAVRRGKIEFFNLIEFEPREITEGLGLAMGKNGKNIDFNVKDLVPNWSLLDLENAIVDKNKFNKIFEKKQQQTKKNKDKKNSPTAKQVPLVIKKEDSSSNESEVNQRPIETMETRKLEFLVAQYYRIIDDLKAKKQGHIKENEDLLAELRRRTKKLRVDKELIERDLLCLQDLRKKCKLFNKELLTKRGVPRLLFSQKGRDRMIDELVSYVGEEEKFIKDGKNKIIEMRLRIKKLEQRILENSKYEKTIKNYDLVKENTKIVRDLVKGAKILNDRGLINDIKIFKREYDI